jgi:hypothetical protein
MNSILKPLKLERYEIQLKSERTKETLGTFDNYRHAIRSYVDLATFFGAKFRISNDSKRLSFEIEEMTISLKKINIS